MRKFALVVGVGCYEDPEINDLPFAARDAVEVGRCLREQCGFDDVRVLASGEPQEPDNTGIVRALRNLAPLVAADDTFLFYFAGHGIHAGGRAYLLTANSFLHMPGLASLPVAVLHDSLATLDCARRVLILDACRNEPRKGMGDGDNPLSPELSRDVAAAAGARAGETVPSTCLLFACSLGQRAYEWADQGHGAFTHYLLEGLRGAARDERGRVTSHSLSAYVQERVQHWARKMGFAPPQQPWSQQFGSLDEIVLRESVEAAPRPARDHATPERPEPLAQTPASEERLGAEPGQGKGRIRETVRRLRDKLVDGICSEVEAEFLGDEPTGEGRPAEDDAPDQ